MTENGLRESLDPPHRLVDEAGDAHATGSAEHDPPGASCGGGLQGESQPRDLPLPPDELLTHKTRAHVRNRATPAE